MNHGQLQISELTAILTEHFQWNKARIACFVGMLIALMVVGTVNLTQRALVFPSRALISSRYRRLQLFFSNHRLDYNEVAHFIMKLFGFTETDYNNLGQCKILAIRVSYCILTPIITLMEWSTPLPKRLQMSHDVIFKQTSKQKRGKP